MVCNSFSISEANCVYWRKLILCSSSNYSWWTDWD